MELELDKGSIESIKAELYLHLYMCFRHCHYMYLYLCMYLHLYLYLLLSLYLYVYGYLHSQPHNPSNHRQLQATSYIPMCMYLSSFVSAQATT